MPNKRDQPSPEERRRYGKQLRTEVPRSEHGSWQPNEERPDPISLLISQGASRVQSLLPLRYERMGISPFTFFRGGALIMASDLAATSSTGIKVQACGDAHIANFGVFNSPERRLVFDINDFDETLPGPWEWDLKRLAASVEICGRDRGFSPEDRAAAVRATVKSYRKSMLNFAKMGNIDVWYAHLDIKEAMSELPTAESAARARRSGSGDNRSGAADAPLRKLEKRLTKSLSKNSARAVERFTERVDNDLRIVSDPPVIVPLRELMASFPNLDGDKVLEVLQRMLKRYKQSIPRERRALVDQYLTIDVARKVVGVGSVGTRCWIVVMQGRDENDPLVLQVKEAEESVLERFCGKSEFGQHGQRVVQGQRAIQTASDVLLGWVRSTGLDGNEHDFYVRQLWDGKGSVDLDRVSEAGLARTGGLCGWTLAHAHARTGDRFAIAGYLGKSDVFDEALVRFAQVYADQNDKDFALFTAARRAGRL